MRFTIEKKHQYKTVYKYNFSNLTDFHNYLSDNPPVNTRIFSTQSSVTGNYSFAGADLTTAIDYLRGSYKVNFDKFDIAVNSLKKIGYQDSDSRKLERCIHGGVYLSPLVAAGVPACMIRYTRDTEPKRITVYFQLAFPHTTTTEQIFNRGVATINLIQALEQKGYMVDLKVFELSKCGDEYINITVNLKQPDEYLNISKCYYPFVSKEFLRRLLFRVLESTPVKEHYWNRSYGRALGTEEMREFYKLRKKDLVIAAPRELDIKGDDIYEDTISLFTSLQLENEFDLDKLKSKVKIR